MTATDRWPWPGDTALDRARRVANSLLAQLAEDEREVWAARAHAIGETWLGATLLRWTADDIVTTAQAGELVHRDASTIRKWHSDGHLRAVARGRYRVGDVLDCSAERRRARRSRAVG